MIRSFGELRNADARNLSSFIKPDTVDITITSPPYYNLKDYKDSRQIGFGQKFDGYANDLKNVFREIHVLTKSSGSLWVVVDNLRLNGKVVLLPFEMAEWIRSTGWILQDILVWDKGKTRPVNRRLGLRKVFENILVFSKQETFKCHSERLRSFDLSRWWVKWPERYNETGKIPTDIWSFQIPTQGNWSRWQIFRDQKLHECPFPPDLVERILQLGTDEGDLVLDPFAGSGMTLAVADAMKRNWIGFEINETYCRNFSNQVLPVVRKWYQEQIAEGIHSQGTRDLQETLQKLRKLKYARLLSQRLVSEVPSFGLVSTFLIENGEGGLEVYVLFDTESPLGVRPDLSFQGQAEKKTQEIVNRTELKTFGIQSRVVVLPAKEFIRTKADLLTTEELWLYKRHHMFESSIKFEDWTRQYTDDQWRERYFVGRTPPLISNIGIYEQDHSRQKEDSTL